MLLLHEPGQGELTHADPVLGGEGLELGQHPLFPLLLPPTGAALRRALVQPAMKCGYRFEDDELVDEMLAEVEGERGALPMLAFAAARLWEKRDRGSGLLTRQAYQDIGGVGGALARHAETTIDVIGHERVPIVRELFRNLVTAEGTRAVREWDELLSVFGESEREAAAEVLTLFGQGEVEVEPTVAIVNAHLCTGCKTCVDLCAYSAISFDEMEKIAVINEALCQGCGTCAASCPVAAIGVQHYTPEQIFAQIEGILS